MIIAIAANDEQKQALEKKGFSENITVLWAGGTVELLAQAGADVFIDCLFTGSTVPQTLVPLLIHSPLVTLDLLGAGNNVARFCAWNSFVERPVWEMAVSKETNPMWLQALMETIGWQFRLVKDEPGLITPRVVSMIINEAFFALDDDISSKADIDTAMKLGTNYPYGPFEWAEKIGVENIYMLLQKLSETDKRYTPAISMAVNG